MGVPQRKSLLPRIGLALLSGGIAAYLAWPWVQSRLKTQTVELVYVDDEVPPETGENGDVVRDLFAPVPEESAKHIFPLHREKFAVYDPVCGFRHKSNLDREQKLPEHPAGKWQLVTNSHGLRMGEIREEQPDLRVLMAGDSHTDGLCDNSDSFSSELEKLLREADPERSVEVINTGKGGYSFYNYLGVLRKFLYTKPDVLVVTVYGGNDFEETLPVHYYFENERRPRGSREYRPLIQKAFQIQRNALAQAMLSLKYFAQFPEQMDAALQSASTLTQHVLDICEREGIRVIYMYLPPVTDIVPDMPTLHFSELCEALEITPEQAGSTEHMADRFLEWLEEKGVETIDLRPIFEDADFPLYWEHDLHVNLETNEMIARELFSRIGG